MTPQKYNKYFILPNIYYVIYINSVYFLDIKKGERPPFNVRSLQEYAAMLRSTQY